MRKVPHFVVARSNIHERNFSQCAETCQNGNFFHRSVRTCGTAHNCKGNNGKFRVPIRGPQRCAEGVRISIWPPGGRRPTKGAPGRAHPALPVSSLWAPHYWLSVIVIIVLSKSWSFVATAENIFPGSKERNKFSHSKHFIRTTRANSYFDTTLFKKIRWIIWTLPSRF